MIQTPFGLPFEAHPYYTCRAYSTTGTVARTQNRRSHDNFPETASSIRATGDAGVDLLARYESTVQIREDQLVARCRAGDVEAFGQVYAQYERQVFRYAYHLVGHREDADDIKQETFLRAYQALPHFKGECSMLCWLLRICGNLCRDRLKSRRRHTESLADPQTTQDLWPGDARAQADPHTLLEQRQARETLRRALAAMPP